MEPKPLFKKIRSSQIDEIIKTEGRDKEQELIFNKQEQQFKQVLQIDDLTMNAKLLQLLSLGHYSISYSEQVMEKIKRARNFVQEQIDKNEPIHGQSTGVGYFSDIIIPKEEIDQFQINIIKSHSCAVGKPLSLERTRMILALRIHEISLGYSLVSAFTFSKLVQAYNLDILPYIPEEGSVSSADTQQLAHLILGLIGYGQIYDEEEKTYVDAKIVLAKKAYKPMKLQEKEGLNLINSSTYVQALGAELVLLAENLANHADLIFSITFEALNGVHDAFHPKIHEIRNHSGQQEVAARIRSLIQENKEPTQMNRELKAKYKRVQDAYSIRCTPQVHGITNDTIKFVKEILNKQLNTVSNNHLVLFDEQGKGSLKTSGSFHGEYMGKAFDYLAIGLQELANISERRIDRLLNPNLSQLPAFLTDKPGICNGFMMAQVTASSLTSQNKVLCHPGSVDSIPTCANQEDHQSMAAISLLKCSKVLQNVQTVLAIELLCAFQGIQYHRPLKSSQKIENILEIIQQFVPFFSQDEIMQDYIKKISGLISSEKLLYELDKFQNK